MSSQRGRPEYELFPNVAFAVRTRLGIGARLLAMLQESPAQRRDS